MPNSPDMFNDSETVTSEDSETISASIDNIELNNSQSLPTGQQSFAGIDSDNSITKENTNIDNNCYLGWIRVGFASVNGMQEAPLCKQATAIASKVTPPTPPLFVNPPPHCPVSSPRP